MMNGRPPSQTSWPPSDHIGDLRERVRALEEITSAAQQMTTERLAAQSARFSGIDTRLAKGDERMNGLQSRLLDLDHEGRRMRDALEPLVRLVERVTSLEQRAAAFKSSAQYAIAAVLFGATLGGHATLDSATRLLNAVLGLLR